MQEHEASRPDSALAYFFFDRSHQHSTVHQALRNICVQLMCHPHFKLSIPQPVKRLQERLKTKPQYSPTLTDLLGLVIDLASCFETTYIIIDALDERISTDYYNSDDILHVLKELCKDERRSNIHLLVSLREEDANLHKNLMTFMKNQPLEGHAHHEDLKAYVRGDIGRQRFLNGKALMPELKEMIVEKVSQKADGM